MNLWGGQLVSQQEHSMINLYKVAKKVILRNPFSTPYKKVPYTALFYHTMTLKFLNRDKWELHNKTTWVCLSVPLVAEI